MKLGIVVLFSLTSFLAAVLLFSAEPMIGKMVLPRFGGTPAVWNSCLVYFQVMLLLGYALSGDLPAGMGIERRRISMPFLAVLAVLLFLAYLMQPLSLSVGVTVPAEIERSPAGSLLGILWISTSLPLLLVASTSPLVQRWFAETGHPRARDPYFLYAASNAGSLLALLCYPFAIEPHSSLPAQARVWRAGFVVLGLLMIACGIAARRLSRTRGASTASGGDRPDAEDGGVAARPTMRTVLHWLVLVSIPSSWLMGVTTYLTTDLAAIPLLWAIPLALYLLSFIIAFSGGSTALVRLASRALPVLVLPLVLVMTAGFVHAVWIPLHLLTFLAGATACHGVLAGRRPAARYLSVYYVTMAAGGLLGGVFNALIAPVIFSRVVEYPLAVILGCLVASGREGRLWRGTRKEWWNDALLPATVFLLTVLLTTNRMGLADSTFGALGITIAAGLGISACVTARRRPIRFAVVAGAILLAGGLSQGPSGRLLHIERSFFGVVRVTEDRQRSVHRLFHGSTLHGQQNLDPARSRDPSTYYSSSGPIGQLFAAIGPIRGRPGTRIAVVGLGAGSLAAYANSAERWTFYEIDPAIERIARDPRYFTYLRDCDAKALDVVVGDARLRLRDAPDHAYQIIVLDAFSSDALPVHLLTREAIVLYRSKLADEGVLAVNLSTRYVDLEPVIGRQAEDAGLICRINYDTELSPEERDTGKQPSIWAVLAATDGGLGALTTDTRWRRPLLGPDTRVWTDDYSDLARYLRWMPRPLAGRRGQLKSSTGIEPESAP